MSETIKLTKEELQNLIEVQQKLNNITLNLGNAELAKQAMFTEYSKVKVDFDIIAKELEEKYGQVNVNLTDGSILSLDISTNSLE